MPTLEAAAGKAEMRLKQARIKTLRELIVRFGRCETMEDFRFLTCEQHTNVRTMPSYPSALRDVLNEWDTLVPRGAGPVRIYDRRQDRFLPIAWDVIISADVTDMTFQDVVLTSDFCGIPAGTHFDEAIFNLEAGTFQLADDALGIVIEGGVRLTGVGEYRTSKISGESSHEG